jgi:hypothetical protein
VPKKSQCQLRVEGETFPEMLDQAMAAASRFFDLDRSLLVIKSTTTAQPVEFVRFATPHTPCTWSMTVTVAIATEDDVDDYFEEDDE